MVLVVHEQGSDGLEIPSEEGNVKEEKELSLGERRIWKTWRPVMGKGALPWAVSLQSAGSDQAREAIPSGQAHQPGVEQARWQV